MATCAGAPPSMSVGIMMSPPPPATASTKPDRSPASTIMAATVTSIAWTPPWGEQAPPICHRPPHKKLERSGRPHGRARRPREPERCALAGRRLDPDAAADGVDDLLHEREADAGALGLHVAKALEELEDA